MQPSSPLSQVRRLPDRGHYDEATIHAILDSAFLCHVAFEVDGQPVLIPTLYARRGSKLYMHGSSASRMVRHLATGARACVAVTLVDGLVVARSAFHHSINYRSVVAFGTARLIDGEEKMAALEAITDSVIPGRWAEVRAPNELEMKATSVLEFTIEEASAKLRAGDPKDDEEDYALPVWAGVLPLATAPGEPHDDGRLAPGVTLPASVSGWKHR